MTDFEFVDGRPWEDLDEEHREYLRQSVPLPEPRWMADPTFVEGGRWDEMDEEHREYLQERDALIPAAA